MRTTVTWAFMLISFFVTPNVFGQNNVLIIQGETEEQVSITGSVTIDSDGSIRVQRAGEQPQIAEVKSFSSSVANNGQIRVKEGESFAIEWTSVNATSCAPSGTFSRWTNAGSLPANSSEGNITQQYISPELGDAGGPYQIGISCQGSSGTAESALLSLVVEPFSCSESPPIPNWTRLTTGSRSCAWGIPTADCTRWSPNLWTTPFLQAGGLTANILTNVNDPRQYVSIAFNTNGMAPNEKGRFNFEQILQAQRKDVIVTLSKCPGDFSAQQQTGCYGMPLFSFRWRGPSSNENTSCVLNPDETYYFNMLSTKSPASTAPASILPADDCGTRREDNSFVLCGALVQPNR